MSRSVTERKEVLDAAREEAQRVKGVLTKGKQDATTANGVKRATSDEHLQKRSKLIRPAAQLIDRDEHRTTSTTKYSIFNIPLVRDPPSYSRTTANPRQLDSLYPYLLYHHGSPSGRRPQSACMANVSHPNNHLKTNNHSKSNPSAAGNERRVNHRRAASWSGDTSTYPDQFQRCSTTLPPLQEHTKWISYRELEILHRLPQHPRIPRIKDVTSISGGYRMIAFPYENVRAFITSRAEACTSSLRLKWCIQAAEAVAFLHKFGITHGDVLPAHFLLDEMLDIKISSFHAATTTEEAAAPSVIEQRYRHPWASFGMAMQEHDVFALGGVIYFIQTGKDPFEALGSVYNGLRK
ncbi:hypothetical protein KEM54_002725 [Ascosphaera aggregata]|nr:hypothetical protein KEM54_002725 [Ascosphaera aggregata]